RSSRRTGSGFSALRLEWHCLESSCNAGRATSLDLEARRETPERQVGVSTAFGSRPDERHTANPLHEREGDERGVGERTEKDRSARVRMAERGGGESGRRQRLLGMQGEKMSHPQVSAGS